MLFGERLSLVRKKKKISQEAIAKSIGVHAPVIGRYERGEVKPSIEVALKLANALEVSLDYLVGSTDLFLDKKIIERIQLIQELDADEQDSLFLVIDAFLRDANAKKAYS